MKVFEDELLIRAKDCDLNGTWRLSAVLEAMQEAAGDHSTLLGCGRETIVRTGIVWVLVRSEVRMDRYPAIGEKIRIKTFPMPVRHRFFPRYYIFTDEQGKRIGMASTLWVLMDINTRQMAAETALKTPLPDNSDLEAPMGFPAQIEKLAAWETESQYRAQYTDLDINQHVNNTRYADWFCNALGTETLRKHEIASVILDYNAEIRPDQEVRLSLKQDGMKCQLAGFCDQKKSFEIGAVLRER